jgi:hypothetical protein
MFVITSLNNAQPLVPGDFNNDGAVNAADYAAWRKGVGVAPTQENYNLWRANFGQPAGGGSGGSSNATVPEPATAVMFIAAGFAGTGRRWRTCRVSKLIDA